MYFSNIRQYDERKRDENPRGDLSDLVTSSSRIEFRDSFKVEFYLNTKKGLAWSGGPAS